MVSFALCARRAVVLGGKFGRKETCDKDRRGDPVYAVFLSRQKAATERGTCRKVHGARNERKRGDRKTVRG